MTLPLTGLNLDEPADHQEAHVAERRAIGVGFDPFYDASRFVAPGNGVMPGTNLCGLAFDKDTPEEAAPFLTYPESWPSVTITLIALTLAAGTVKLEFVASPTTVLFDVVAVGGFVEQVIAEDLTWSLVGATTGRRATTGHIKRLADDVGDTLDDDFIVLGLYLSEGS